MMKQLPSTFWHTRHQCKHSVYWSDQEVAFLLGAYPCPWCGGQAGRAVPGDVPIIRDQSMDVYAFREKLADGSVPWPKDAGRPPSQVILRHRADESCCQ